MKKLWKFLLPLCLFLVIFVSLSGPAQAASQSDAVNWAKAQVGKGLDYDGVYGNQCVDLIYYYYNYLGAPCMGGNASDYSWNTLPSGWQRISCYSGFVPQPGDIAVWWANHSCSSCITGEAGHIGIITSATSSTITVVDQNSYTAGMKCAYNTYPTSALTCVVRPKYNSNSAGIITWNGSTKQVISSTNATIATYAEMPAIYNTTKVGIYLYDENENLLKSKTEGTNLNSSYFEIWYDINAELGYTLTPATTYKYKFMAVVNGTTYYSSVKTFTTAGYTVTYDANGGSNAPAAQKKAAGITIYLRTETPTRTGYNFLGWATKSSATTAEYAPGAKYSANENATLYAVWARKTYTVSYNANSGTNAPASQTKTYGITLTLSETVPTRTGYTFLGWSVSSSDTTVSYTPGASYTSNSSITLYAVWKINTYTVSYNANGGTGAPATQTKNHGTNLTISGTKPTRSGHSFLGWGTGNTATTVAYTPGSTYSSNSSVTLYAIWAVYEYAIDYNANGGAGAPDRQTKIYGEALTLSSTIPTRDGYTFLGWATTSSAVSATYSSGQTYSVNADATLYAVWKANTYTVSYNTNGGSGTIESQTKTYGKPLSITNVSPVRTGYTFLGWSADKNATSASYSSGSAYTNNASITLYAVWRMIPTTNTQGTCNHAVMEISAAAATHSAAGNIKFYQCSKCGMAFLDSAAKNNISIDSTVLAQIDHNYGGNYKYDHSEHWQECSCGSIRNQAAHILGSWYTLKAPTATNSGINERKCSLCGYTEQANVAATGTTEETSPENPTEIPPEQEGEDVSAPEIGNDGINSALPETDGTVLPGITPPEYEINDDSNPLDTNSGMKINLSFVLLIIGAVAGISVILPAIGLIVFFIIKRKKKQ